MPRPSNKFSLQHAGKIAAVIVEPVAANMGVVPPAAEFSRISPRHYPARWRAPDFRRSDHRLSHGLRRRAKYFTNSAGSHRARKNYRRGIAGRRLRRAPRNHGHDCAARSRLSGRHAFRQSAGDARRPWRRCRSWKRPTFTNRSTERQSALPPDCARRCSKLAYRRR